MKLVATIKMSGLAKIYGNLKDGFIYELTDEEVKMNPAAMKYFISSMQFGDFFFNGLHETAKEMIDRLADIDKDIYDMSFFCKDIEAGYWHFKYLNIAHLMFVIQEQAESFCKAIAKNDYTGSGNAFDYDARIDSKIVFEEEEK